MPLGLSPIFHSAMAATMITRESLTLVPETVTVLPGEFCMGASEADDRFASRLELPRHRVWIEKPFAIGRFPVTFAEWDAYADAVPSAHRPDDLGWGRGQSRSAYSLRGR